MATAADGLEGMYSAIRAGVTALDELVGNSDVSPSTRFTP
jgi:hypothetical protein